MITTITTTSIIGAAASAGSLGLIAIVTLLLLLIQKEIAGGLAGERARRLSKALNVGIVPLVIVFVITVGLRIISTFRP
jgi:hypothetical protein